MALDPSKLSPELLEIFEKRGVDPSTLSAEEGFSEFCEWFGIKNGWGEKLVETMTTLTEAHADPVVEEFDPYTDTETRKMLELAGIATHRYRN